MRPEMHWAGVIASPSSAMFHIPIAFLRAWFVPKPVV
jgi:hypothetical protein